MQYKFIHNAYPSIRVLKMRFLDESVMAGVLNQNDNMPAPNKGASALRAVNAFDLRRKHLGEDVVNSSKMCAKKAQRCT